MEVVVLLFRGERFLKQFTAHLGGEPQPVWGLRWLHHAQPPTFASMIRRPTIDLTRGARLDPWVCVTRVRVSVFLGSVAERFASHLVESYRKCVDAFQRNPAQQRSEGLFRLMMTRVPLV